MVASLSNFLFIFFLLPVSLLEFPGSHPVSSIVSVLSVNRHDPYFVLLWILREHVQE